MALRLVHLSDFHLASRPVRGEWNFKRLLGHMNWVLNRQRRHSDEKVVEGVAKALALRPDVVALTGDVAQTGLPAEFERAEGLLAPLTGVGIPVLLVSGNHDRYGADAAGSEAFARLQQRLRLHVPVDDLGVARLGNVEILMMDQGYPCGLFRSNGRIAAGYRDRMLSEWGARPEGTVRLALGHYPLAYPRDETWEDKFHGFRTRMGLTGLLGAEGLLNAMTSCGVKGYFCGHLHTTFGMELPGGIWQYCADSTSRGGVAVPVYRCSEGGVWPEGGGSSRRAKITT